MYLKAPCVISDPNIPHFAGQVLPGIKMLREGCDARAAPRALDLVTTTSRTGTQWPDCVRRPGHV